MSGGLAVQVCYARPGLTFLRDLQVAPGSTVRQAIMASNVLREVPDLDLTNARIAIYNKIAELDTVLRARDRVEICRPLQCDPKEMRRQRAALRKAAGG